MTPCTPHELVEVAKVRQSVASPTSDVISSDSNEPDSENTPGHSVLKLKERDFRIKRKPKISVPKQIEVNVIAEN